MTSPRDNDARTSPRDSFRQTYMAYAGISEDRMPAHRRGARFALVLLALAVIAVLVFADWTWIGAGAIAAVIVWGIPVLGTALMVVLGLAVLAVWG